MAGLPIVKGSNLYTHKSHETYTTHLSPSFIQTVKGTVRPLSEREREREREKERGREREVGSLY